MEKIEQTGWPSLFFTLEDLRQYEEIEGDNVRNWYIAINNKKEEARTQGKLACLVVTDKERQNGLYSGTQDGERLVDAFLIPHHVHYHSPRIIYRRSSGDTVLKWQETPDAKCVLSKEKVDGKA